LTGLKRRKLQRLIKLNSQITRRNAYLCTTFQTEPEFIKKNLRAEADHDYTASEIALLALHAVMRPGKSLLTWKTLKLNSTGFSLIQEATVSVQWDVIKLTVNSDLTLTARPFQKMI
jgi:predicted nucleotide-binding protein (sugar kinase/HSP70/actin superfamily)